MTIDIQDTSNLDETWVAKTKELISEPHDFHKWLELIKFTENLNGGVVKNSSLQDKYLLIKTYENLLQQFPCLEKFWCDFAQWYFKLGYTDDCFKIFEKALSIIPYSIVIWMDYLKLLIFHKSGKVSYIINQFEKARLKIGLHYYSDKFYDLYLTYLLKNDEAVKYHSLLRRILEIPIYQYSKFFNKWFQIIENCDLQQVQYIITQKDLQSKFQIHTSDLSNAKALQDLKVKLKKLFIDLYITTQYHSYQFYQFEKNLLIQFYQPLANPSQVELQSWIDYAIYLETLLLNHSNTKDKLNYQIQLQYIITLYERMLIIHCDEVTLWLKYINFQISLNNFHLAIDICKKSLQFKPIDLQLNFKLIDLLTLQSSHIEAHGYILKLYKFHPSNISVFIKLLICEHNVQLYNGHSEFPIDDHLISLVTRKLSSPLTMQDPIWDHLFQEIQEFKIIEIDKLKSFITSFKDSRKSLIYWKILLEFIDLHSHEELSEYVSLARNNCQDFEKLPQLYITFSNDTDDLKWLDRF